MTYADLNCSGKTRLPIERTYKFVGRHFLIKFMFSKKATKIDGIFIVDLTSWSKGQINVEDVCGLLRNHEL